MLPVPSNPNRDPRALIEAIEKGNLAKVQELLPSADHLENFQTKDKKTGDSLIHFAVRGGNNKILEFLLKEIGLDSNLANKNEDYPLNLAAEKDDKEAVEILLEAGAISLPDKFGNTPLHTVIENNNIDGFNMLLKAGADINVLNSAGQSPLKVAEITKECIQAHKKTYTPFVKLKAIVMNQYDMPITAWHRWVFCQKYANQYTNEFFIFSS